MRFPSHAEDDVGQPLCKRPRVDAPSPSFLEEQVGESVSEVKQSEPTEPGTVACVLDGMARYLKVAFEQGKIFSEDGLNASTAEFWIRSYATYMCKPEVQSSWGDEGPPAAAHLFLRFIIKQILSAETLYSDGLLAKLTDWVTKLGDAHPSLKSPVARCMHTIAIDEELCSKSAWKFQVTLS